MLRHRIHGGNTIAKEHGKMRAEWAMAVGVFFSLFWDRPGAPPIDWVEAGIATGVLRHHGPARPDQSPLLRNEAFKERVRGWI